MTVEIKEENGWLINAGNSEIFYNQALAHYDQIQKDMADYARLSGNAI